MMDADVIIVGAGVLGTFHAYHALKQNLKVILLEKDTKPLGATVRNFGQIVPSGMSQGKWQQYGIESTHIYKNIQAEFDISVKQEGSIYIASDHAELGLLEELVEINKDNDYPSVLLTKQACLQRYPHLNKDYCKGGLYFPEEITVNPRQMIYRVLEYLQEKGLEYHPSTHITSCNLQPTGAKLEDALGNVFCAAKVIICNGHEFKTLFPKVFWESDLELSKLQMLKTKALNLQLRGSILTGLTIRRYESFRECPSFSQLDDSQLNPAFKQWGIHILFTEANDGSVTIGDSHEYADAKAVDSLGFDIRKEINDLILAEAQRIFPLNPNDIELSWVGYYTQCKTKDIYNKEILPDIHIVTGIGGKGMTASAGFAKRNIKNIFNGMQT